MGKFVVIVLDGFGVGAMPDVPQVRPADCGANTCVHIFERTPDLKLACRLRRMQRSAVPS